jgi:hypothetical protein
LVGFLAEYTPSTGRQARFGLMGVFAELERLRGR